MTNIWGVIIYTLDVSLVALIILLLKKILVDKLSPRWQYGIWSVLFITLLTPNLMFRKYNFWYVQVFVEAVKTMIEKMLSSHYIRPYQLIDNSTVLPYVKQQPSSVTDWLFIVYIIGILILLIKYAYQYVHLRKIVSLSDEPSDVLIQQVNFVASQYHLKTCSIKVVDGLPSAFIIGTFKPILVLPNKRIDDNVILHELLHYHYKDVLQSIIWTLFRVLHWCNPFMQKVFNTIQNDMESLCDQRVLERLEGEQRREYGRTLLAMTNESYPSSFGTTSLSNGSHFIGKRIEAIVRFKKYPQGMAIVSICIGVLLIPLVLGETFPSNKMPIEYMLHLGETDANFDYQLALASSRLIKYETMASAIDAYAKSFLTGDKQVFLSVSPESMFDHPEEGWKDLSQDFISQDKELYFLSDLKKEKNESYSTYLLFFNRYNIENEEDSSEVETYVDYTIIPIKISHNNGWVIEKNGNIIDKKEVINKTYDLLLMEDFLKKTIDQEYDQLNISIAYESRLYIEKEMMEIDDFDIWGSNLISCEPSLDIDFERAFKYFEIDYEMIEDLNENEEFIGMTLEPLDEKRSMTYLETPFQEEGLYEEYSDFGGRSMLEKKDIKDKQIKCGFYIDEPVFLPTQYYCLKIWFSDNQFIELRIDIEKGEVYEYSINQ